MEFHLGSLTPDGNHRFARVVNTNDNNLYSVLTTRIDYIDGLATDPPYADGADDGESPSG